MNKKNGIGLGLLVCCVGIQTQASVVYEGFDYTVATDIVGLGTATDGWAGAWAGSDDNAAGTPEVRPELADGLGAGGSYGRPVRNGVAQSNRLISDASKALLTGDNSTIYFSVLMNVNSTEGGVSGGGFSANSNGALIFGDTAYGLLDNPASAPMANTGNGLGVSFDGDDSAANVSIRGVSYKGGVRTWDADALTIGESTVMILGKIDWAANGTDDVLSLYNITDTSAALPTAFATMSSNWDQSTFNMVAIGQGQTEVFDEIRFDTDLANVIPEPATLGLVAAFGGAVLFIRRRFMI